jgi:hypothetical protein
VHVLPVRGDDGEQQHHDGGADPRAEVVGGGAGDGQDEQDLSRRVRHRGKGVGGEDGQRDPLREERFRKPVAAERTPEEKTLRQMGHPWHGEDRMRCAVRSFDGPL